MYIWAKSILQASSVDLDEYRVVAEVNGDPVVLHYFRMVDATLE